MTIIKKYSRAILWAAAACACIILLSLQTQAAEFRFGPGDHYDTEGNIVSAGGTVLVTADGTVVKEPFSDAGQNSGGAPAVISAAGSSVYTVSGKGNSRADTASATDTPPSYTVSGTGDGAKYSCEGKTYVKAASYGRHKLTGYAAEETGSAGTYSGKAARPHHTVSAPSDLPIGTVIIVEGASGPYPDEFNGVYFVEDRGGYVLESQGIIDIFCGSLAEARHITDAGWNYADIWIAEPVS